MHQNEVVALSGRNWNLRDRVIQKFAGGASCCAFWLLAV